jgi:putative membrane protein insertion efficiency factor
MSRFLIACIRIYQKAFSLDTGYLPKVLGWSRQTCSFYPTCSEYTAQALKKYGFFKGLHLGVRRIARCTPWHEGEVDLVP